MKSGPKSKPKNLSKKVNKNVVPGSSLGRPNHPKWDQGRPKVKPKSKNDRFLKGRFFDDFLDGPLLAFLRFFLDFGVPKGTRFYLGLPLFFFFFSMFFPASLPTLTRGVSRPVLEPFWSILEWFWDGFGLQFCLWRKGISRENLAKTLHKILQTAWATPPACTNSEGAAVSR